jgi:hypothetical protein
MKKILIVLVLLCFVGKAESHVTRKEVRAAKAKYLNAKYGPSRPFHMADADSIFVGDKEMISLDSLYWRGLRAIRHDQKIWVRKH